MHIHPSYTSRKAQIPQPITQVMRILHHRPLALRLDLIRPSSQRPNRTRLLLALRHNHHRLSLGQLPAPPSILHNALLHFLPLLERLCPIDGQPSSRGRQSRRHQRRSRKHKANGSAIDPNARKRLREAVHELQVRQQVGPVILVEERHGVEHVEGVSVGQLHAREGGLLGEDLFDVGRQERVRGEEVLAQRALGGGFELLLGSALEAVMKNARVSFRRKKSRNLGEDRREGLGLMAYVLFFEHFCGGDASEWAKVF